MEYKNLIKVKTLKEGNILEMKSIENLIKNDFISDDINLFFKEKIIKLLSSLTLIALYKKKEFATEVKRKYKIDYQDLIFLLELFSSNFNNGLKFLAGDLENTFLKKILGVEVGNYLIHFDKNDLKLKDSFRQCYTGDENNSLIEKGLHPKIVKNLKEFYNSDSSIFNSTLSLIKFRFKLKEIYY